MEDEPQRRDFFSQFSSERSPSAEILYFSSPILSDGILPFASCNSDKNHSEDFKCELGVTVQKVRERGRSQETGGKQDDVHKNNSRETGAVPDLNHDLHK